MMKIGKIVVNWGSMFSGKTEELIRQLKRADYANKSAMLFKPHKDTRNEEKLVLSHGGEFRKCYSVLDSSVILQVASDFKLDVIGIDEAQFFDDGIIEVIKELSLQGMDVHVSGLDMMYDGTPFPIMMNLAAISDECKKLKAVCLACGEDAYISKRLIEDDSEILVGGAEIYRAECRACFTNN